MTKIKLTLNDQNIDKLTAAEQGTRYDAWDIVVPGLSVRVTDSGAKSFSLSAKLPGMSNTTRLTIGRVGAVTLKQARQTARDWLELISNGKDPRGVVLAKQAAQAKEVDDTVKNSFRTVAASYIATRLGHLTEKSRADVIRNIETLFVPAWGDKRHDSILARDITEIMVPLAAKTPGRARVALAHVKTLFNWAANAGYAPASVALLINANKLLGPRIKGDRILTDAELARVWRGATELGYPLGPIYQLLILTGCRLNEVVQARWDEIDLAQRLWVMPKSRMKGKKGQRRDHAFRLTDQMLAVLNSLPHQGEYLFSRDGGATPIQWHEEDKVQIERECGFSDWVNHDIRRTMRTRLSPKQMGVDHHIAELMIAHVPSGVSTHYDYHTYLDEISDGFVAWNNKVSEIIGRPPTKPTLKLVA